MQPKAVSPATFFKQMEKIELLKIEMEGNGFNHRFVYNLFVLVTSEFQSSLFDSLVINSLFISPQVTSMTRGFKPLVVSFKDRNFIFPYNHLTLNYSLECSQFYLGTSL